MIVTLFYFGKLFKIHVKRPSETLEQKNVRRSFRSHLKERGRKIINFTRIEGMLKIVYLR